MTQVAPMPPRRSRRSAEDEPGAERSAPHGPPVGTALRGRHATTRGQGFDRVVGWTILGSLVPGVGLIVSGRRTVGRLLLGAAALTVAALLSFAALGHPVDTLAPMLVSRDKLLALALAAGVLGLAWVALVLSTHASLRRFATPTGPQRGLSLALVTALIALGLIPAAEVGNYALITRDTVTSVFSSNGAKLTEDSRRPSTAAENPWADIPRVNVLLVGSDSGKDREGTRPDTLIVASIDTATGDTVLVSLPRNLENVPLPKGSPMAARYPDGYRCADPNGVPQCLINAVWQEAEAGPQEFFRQRHIADPGLWSTAQVVQNVTGLGLDYYALVDLKGFVDFIDALGGLTVTVRQKLPIGGHVVNGREVGVTGYLLPGRRELTGYEALWFARSRSDTDDFDRMRRQRCVIGAVVQQADPATVALKFPSIARVARENIKTDIPLSNLDAWVELTLRVKNAKVKSLNFTNQVVHPGNPDFGRMRALVKKALQPVVKPSAPVRRPKTPSTGVDAKDSSSAVDLQQVC